MTLAAAMSGSSATYSEPFSLSCSAPTQSAAAGSGTAPPGSFWQGNST